MVEIEERPQIGIMLMVKNEAERIELTLNSVADITSVLFVYDTGSTDDTVEIITRFSQDFGIPLELLRGEFEDFSTSRNRLMAFADESATKYAIEYYLLLDANDELRNSDQLIRFCREKQNAPEETAWYLTRIWSFHKEENVFVSNRLLRPNRGWFFDGVVHEDLCNRAGHWVRMDDDARQIVLFNDRRFDDAKTAARQARDKELLLHAYWKEPTGPRTVFYLARAFFSLGEIRNALKFFRLRAEMADDYREEMYETYLSIGRCEKGFQNYDEAIVAFLKAYEYYPRVEALVELGRMYFGKPKDNHALAFTFFRMACEQEYPKDSRLFLVKGVYDYDRFHYLGIIAYYRKEYALGEWACRKAIEARNLEIDRKNLNVYLEHAGQQAQQAQQGDGTVGAQTSEQE